jgi:membrane protease YdiL (CAAX protease family)
LVRTKQVANFQKCLKYVELGDGLVLGAALAVVLLMVNAHPSRGNDKNVSLVMPCVCGVVAGLLVPLFSLPITIKASEPLGLVDLYVNILTHPVLAVVSFFTSIILAFMVEKVFRGLIFSASKERLGLGAAILATSAVTALCWPFTDVLTAFLLGIVACLLFEWTACLWPGVLAFIVGTASCISILSWRALSGCLG